MVSLSMVKSKGLPVNLPGAASGEAQNRDEFTTITVTADNTLLFNKQPIAAADLAAALQKLKAENSDPKIFINGDEASRLGMTILVLDEARRCGITKVSFETKRSRSRREPRLDRLRRARHWHARAAAFRDPPRHARPAARPRRRVLRSRTEHRRFRARRARRRRRTAASTSAPARAHSTAIRTTARAGSRADARARRHQTNSAAPPASGSPETARRRSTANRRARPTFQRKRDRRRTRPRH